MVVALKSNSVLLKYKSDDLLYYFRHLQPWMRFIADVGKESDHIAMDEPGYAATVINRLHMPMAYGVEQTASSSSPVGAAGLVRVIRIRGERALSSISTPAELIGLVRCAEIGERISRQTLGGAGAADFVRLDVPHSWMHVPCQGMTITVR